ncbi:hypothetical protein [Runella limosa]|uniref:hypothetical protein n=1 Tax=Runella limosa TaxID=370978 RepID=UPI00048BD7E4|nr:hypothetical protein [Runella limosa]
MSKTTAGLTGFLIGATLYVAWYFYYVAHYSVDIPYLDDYDAILDYLLKFREATGGEKLRSIFLPHNEHIISMTRLVSWVDYGLTGQINIAALVLLGNGLLLLPLGLLYRTFVASHRYPAHYFLLVVFIFLNPQYSVTSLWAMALWSNIWVLVPVAFSTWLLTSARRWYWAIPLAMVATFSNGNGLMIWPIGLLILLLERRLFLQWTIWGGLGVITCGSYFYLMRQQPSEGLFLLSNLPLLPFNVLAFLGSYGALLGGKAGQIIAVIVGMGVAAMTLITAKNYLKTRHCTDLILLALVAFVALTALAVGLFRAEKGMSIIIGGRYRQYSSLAVAVSLLMAFRHLPFHLPRWGRVSIWGLVGLVTVLSFYRDIGLRKTTEWRTIVDYHNRLHNRLDVLGTSLNPQFGADVVEAKQSGLFIVTPPYDLLTQLNSATRTDLASQAVVERFEEKKLDGVTCGNYWLIEEPQLQFPSRDNEAIYLVLSKDNQHVVFPTASKRNSLAAMVKQRSYFRKGLEAEVYDCLQPFDAYEINWLKVGEKPVLYTTHTTFSQFRIRSR